MLNVVNQFSIEGIAHMSAEDMRCILMIASTRWGNFQFLFLSAVYVACQEGTRELSLKISQNIL